MTYPVTVDQFREHVTTSLSDDALQTLLDAAAEAIDGYDVAPLQVDGPVGHIPLPRPASSITTVTELVGSVTTTLAADDYRLRAEGYVLERLDTGTNKSRVFRGFITVTYAGEDDEATREAVQIALVQLDLDTDASTGGAIQSRRIGEYSETFADSEKTLDERRGDILSRLGSGTGGFIRVVGGPRVATWY